MEIADARRFQMQSFMTIKNWTTVAVFGFNGRAVFGFNGGAVFGFNGRAVSLDSQGCKPLVGIPTMIRESRSDGIGPSDTIGHHTNTTNRTVNATAPPFPNLRGAISRGLHPWLSNAIALRLKTNTLRLRDHINSANRVQRGGHDIPEDVVRRRTTCAGPLWLM